MSLVYWNWAYVCTVCYATIEYEIGSLSVKYNFHWPQLLSSEWKKRKQSKNMQNAYNLLYLYATFHSHTHTDIVKQSTSTYSIVKTFIESFFHLNWIFFLVWKTLSNTKFVSPELKMYSVVARKSEPYIFHWRFHRFLNMCVATICLYGTAVLFSMSFTFYTMANTYTEISISVNKFHFHLHLLNSCRSTRVNIWFFTFTYFKCVYSKPFKCL